MRSLSRHFRRPVVLLALCCMLLQGCSGISSESIRDSISRQIDHAAIGGHAIDIEVRQGVVSLDGTVASDADRRTVENIATNTEGVKKLDSSLVVSGNGARAQPELAKLVWQNIKAHDMIGAYQISILAASGEVTISGTAGSSETREAIENIARATAGVSRVKNEISVIR